MNVGELHNLLTAIYGDLEGTEGNEYSIEKDEDFTLQDLDTPNGLNLDFHTKVVFKSGDVKSLGKYFTTKINKCNLDIELCRDVVPDYFPRIMNGNLYLKDPIYVETNDYSQLPPFLCSTYRGGIDGMYNITNPPSGNLTISYDTTSEINTQKFKEAYDHYSWASYPRKLPNRVYGSLIVDCGHLTDLDELPRIIGNKKFPKCLWLKDYDSKIIDLRDFKFGSLILENCCFQKLLGLPEVMDILVIKEGRKFVNGNLKYRHHFDIKFPKTIRQRFVIHSHGFTAGRQPTYNIDDMHVYGQVSLRDAYIEGNLYLEDQQADTLQANPILNLVNVNSIKGKSFTGNLTVINNKNLYYLWIENSNIPEFNKPLPNLRSVVFKNLKEANLPETNPYIAGRTMIFDACDESVMKAVCNNTYSKSSVKYLGILKKFNAGETLDLTKFKNLSALLIDGQQRDIKGIDTKPLTFKLPIIKPVANDAYQDIPDASDFLFPDLSWISLNRVYSVDVWKSDYVTPFMEAGIIKKKENNPHPQDQVVFANLVPYTLSCNWEAIKDAHYNFDMVKIHNPFEFFDKVGNTLSNMLPTLMFESFSLTGKYKDIFEAKLLDRYLPVDEPYLNYFTNFVFFLDAMNLVKKPMTDIAPIVAGIATYEVVQEYLRTNSDECSFTEWVLRKRTLFNNVTNKRMDMNYLKTVLEPVLEEQVNELKTQLLTGGF